MVEAGTDDGLEVDHAAAVGGDVDLRIQPLEGEAAGVSLCMTDPYRPLSGMTDPYPRAGGGATGARSSASSWSGRLRSFSLPEQAPNQSGAAGCMDDQRYDHPIAGVSVIDRVGERVEENPPKIGVNRTGRLALLLDLGKG